MPETSLHRALKSHYSDDPAHHEVTVDGYRIDVATDGLLIEIQHASLSAIRPKIRQLLKKHRVLVVKPLAQRKTLIKRSRKRGKVVSRRVSPRHETVFDMFLELVHFVDVFPHPNLTLEVLLTEIEEHRLPRLRSRWTRKPYRTEDRKLIAVHDTFVFHTAADLQSLLPAGLPSPFSTEDIAAGAGIPRWLAQKMAYCLRKTGAIESVGKRGNGILYDAGTAESKAA